MAAGNTYVAIAEQTLGSAAASVTFSSISAAYTDLVLVISGGTTSGTAGVQCQFNGDTTTNYSHTILSTYLGTDSRRVSNSAVMALSFTGFPSVALGQNITIVHFMNYSNTTTYKTAISRSSRTVATTGTDLICGLWRSTAAINQILINLDSSTFMAGSTFSLYGIAAA